MDSDVIDDKIWDDGDTRISLVVDDFDDVFIESAANDETTVPDCM